MHEASINALEEILEQLGNNLNRNRVYLETAKGNVLDYNNKIESIVKDIENIQLAILKLKGGNNK